MELDFKNVEDVKNWFQNNMYEKEVHESINFLIKENEKLKKQVEVMDSWRQFHAQREVELIEKYRGIKLPD